MPPSLTQRYGFPFRGYKFLEPSQLAPRGYIVGDDTLNSHDLLLDPIDGKLMRRGGAASVGSNTGLLEVVVGDFSARGLQILPFDSLSLTDGYPTHLVLFADEAKAAAWMYWRSTNGAGFDLNFGEVGGHSNHYPPDETVGAEFVCMPIAYEANATGLTRGTCTDSAGAKVLRRFYVAGSRRLIQFGNDLFAPGFTASPACWRGKRWNDETASGTTIERFGPTGLVPPLWPGRFVTANLPTATTTAAAWKEGDQFYASVAFVNEDGEVSMPYMPSGATGVTASGEYATDMGLVTVPSTTANVDYYQYLRRTAVPIGPGGTQARLMLRSPKVDSTLAGAAPNRLTLRVCGIIRDNTTTTFDDYLGNDLSIVEALELVRLDRKWPDRARYIWPFDQRAGIACLRPNPYAIVLAPTGVAASRDTNPADTAAFGANAVFLVRVISGTLQLRISDNIPAGSVTGTTSVTLSSTKTLRQVVDEINGTLADFTNGKEWAGQLVPGVSEDIPSDQLMLTYFTVAVCTSANGSPTLTTANSFVDVAVGMRVTGTNIPTDTFVKSVESTTSLTMTRNATGNINGTAAFSCDADDSADASGGATLGNFIVLGQSWPLALPFKKSYLDNFPTRFGDVAFTTGGPLDPPYAGNSYVTGNRKPTPQAAGFAMGGAPLLNGCVTYFSRAIGRLANIRGGKSGDDADYRSEIESWGRGCISPYSIVWGNGWAGCLTDVGFEVRDSLGSRIISGDLYNPSTETGEWAYEIQKCKAAANSIDGRDFQFYAHVESGKLYVSYRRSASNTVPAHMMVYNFSASVEGSGLAQVLRPDGTPWGWSAPLTYSWRSHSATGGVAGAIGSVRKSDGTRIYVCDDTNDKTNCGLVQQIENGTWTDGSGRVTADGYLALDLHDTLEAKSAQRLRVMYHAPGAAERAMLYRTKNQSGGQTLVLPITTAPGGILRVPVQLAERTITNQTQIRLQALGGAGSTKVHFFGAELDVDVLPGLNADGG